MLLSNADFFKALQMMQIEIQSNHEQISTTLENFKIYKPERCLNIFEHGGNFGNI